MKIILPSLLIALLIAALACSSAAQQAPDLIGATPVAKARPDETVLIKGPLSPDGLQAILGTSDLGIGENRVGFVVTSPNGLVRSPVATVSSLYFPGGAPEGERKETTLATFQQWPLGTRGLYTTRMTFDKPGRWGIDIAVLDASGVGRQAQLFFEVAQSSSAPTVGAQAVRSRNKTIKDVDSIGKLTTGSLHDAELYQTTIADAITTGLPTVVVMASPAFCINAVCGPQVEVLKELKDRYKGQANFIHVDLYDNPDEIQGDLGRAVISPTVIEWGLPSNEWSFVIDRNGAVSARFEAFATLEELEQALRQVL